MRHGTQLPFDRNDTVTAFTPEARVASGRGLHGIVEVVTPVNITGVLPLLPRALTFAQHPERHVPDVAAHLQIVIGVPRLLHEHEP